MNANICTTVIKTYFSKSHIQAGCAVNVIPMNETFYHVKANILHMTTLWFV